MNPVCMKTRWQPARRARKSRLESGGQTKKRKVAEGDGGGSGLGPGGGRGGPKIHSELRPILSGSASSSTVARPSGMKRHAHGQNAGRRQPGLRRGNPTASDCSVTGSCSSTVRGRRRKGRSQSVVITRGRKGPRVQMQPKQPHKWKAEATAHFLEAAVELADDVCLVPHKMRRHACTLIRDKMVEKGSPEVSVDVVRSKFNTFLADWRGYNNLKLRFGSCFNPVTATFDAPQDWWDELRDKKLKKFQKGIPHMEELDKIFRHMESPSLCYKCGSNSHSCSTSKTDLGYHHSQSSKQLSLSHGVPGYLDLLDELEKGGVNPNCADYFTATNLLRCPQLRTVYSRRASIDEKVTMLRELREQGTSQETLYAKLTPQFSSSVSAKLGPQFTSSFTSSVSAALKYLNAHGCSNLDLYKYSPVLDEKRALELFWVKDTYEEKITFLEVIYKKKYASGLVETPLCQFSQQSWYHLQDDTPPGEQ